RYSVPCEWVNAMVSVRVYHDHLMVVSPDGEFIRLKRCFDRDQTIYDWTHYIALIERKPGALRNGAPFRTMPEPLRQLQDQLLRHPGGDRVMAQVLNAVTLHGLEAVLVAVELALQSGRVSAEHVLNVLSRLKEPTRNNEPVHTHLSLSQPSQANVDRYDRLRTQPWSDQEENHA
ncbi:MAG: IS21 family transposase, partial [Rubrivivax sp.]